MKTLGLKIAANELRNRRVRLSSLTLRSLQVLLGFGLQRFEAFVVRS
jgi:hypothetical protein